MKGIKSNSRGYIGQSQSSGQHRQRRADERVYENTVSTLLETKNNLPPAARKRQQPIQMGSAKSRVPSHHVGNSHQRTNGRGEPGPPNRQNSVQPLAKKLNADLSQNGSYPMLMQNVSLKKQMAPQYENSQALQMQQRNERGMKQTGQNTQRKLNQSEQKQLDLRQQPYENTPQAIDRTFTISPKSDPRRGQRYANVSDGFNQLGQRNEFQNVTAGQIVRKSHENVGKGPFSKTDQVPSSKKQVPPPGPGDMLSAEDLAKIFGGNQDNFMMLKGLLNQTGLTKSQKPATKSNINGQAVPLRQQASKPQFIRPTMSYQPSAQGTKTSASTFAESSKLNPGRTQLSPLPQAPASQATDLKVEQALLDLNDLKSEAMNQPLPNSTQNKFLAQTTESGFQNLNNTASTSFQKIGVSSSGFGKPPQAPIGNQTLSGGRDLPMTNTQHSFFSQNASRPGDSLDQLSQEQLKERLIVAETIMKKLYNRNKELEEYHNVAQKKPDKDDHSYEGDDIDDSTAKINSNGTTQDQKAIEDLERLLTDFRKREALFEKELQERDDKIRQLQSLKTETEPQMNDLKREKQELKENRYVQFLETRMEECLEENKRYHLKYCDLRDFSYTQIETLVRQLNSKKKTSIQNSNLNVYKQLFEKERKQWLSEKEKSDEALGKLQERTMTIDKEMREHKERMQQLVEEIQQRNDCEAKVQEYVQTLIAKNKELQAEIQAKR